MNRKKIFYVLIAIFIFSVYINNDIVYSAAPKGMQLVPAGEFQFHVEYRWREGLTLDTLVYDDHGFRYRFNEKVYVPAFYIDKTEVTNEQFKAFLDATHYKPQWPENFLKHWSNGMYPAGKANHPVVWISLEDACAFAKWAGKRLPSEQEWQKAAQGTDGRDWPWGNVYDPNKANIDSDDTQAVGSYPQGASPYGCLDMTGNVWEWTDSFASDGYHYFSWIRGGSYFFAKGSLWYMQGGPIANYQRTKYWYMTPALNRSSSIGFRCVKDAK
ncbi:MAG TPA: SUMF1/EgtB/PvdO family nonheme iron enzyme [bacterium]|nr:SUMF1/EgtB/PvdO family nonheme iron enzyme [bacterium]HPN43078.1 SUMF1/EgtB/PvdO family nonheme iron enzyme [bacterium]